jgi:hypothetical protein
VCVKPRGGGIGVDIESVLEQAGNARAIELAAERKHEPIIGKPPFAGRCCHVGHPSHGIDRRYFGGHMLDLDRSKHGGERDRTSLRSFS